MPKALFRPVAAIVAILLAGHIEAKNYACYATDVNGVQYHTDVFSSSLKRSSVESLYRQHVESDFAPVAEVECESGDADYISIYKRFLDKEAIRLPNRYKSDAWIPSSAQRGGTSGPSLGVRMLAQFANGLAQGQAQRAISTPGFPGTPLTPAGATQSYSSTLQANDGPPQAGGSAAQSRSSGGSHASVFVIPSSSHCIKAKGRRLLGSMVTARAYAYEFENTCGERLNVWACLTSPTETCRGANLPSLYEKKALSPGESLQIMETLFTADEKPSSGYLVLACPLTSPTGRPVYMEVENDRCSWIDFPSAPGSR
jgi:hypothetical protein